MGRTVSTLTAILVLAAAATTAQAGVTVTQVDGDLYVVGDKANDSVRVRNSWNEVEVYVPADANQGNKYYEVDKVWVDMGNGDDYVDVDDYGYTGWGADVSVVTGGGDDYVDLYSSYSEHIIEVSTGNGEDYVDAYVRYTRKPFVTYDRSKVIIDTGNDGDVVFVKAYASNYVEISTKNGEDYVYADVDRGSHITVDTGNADDEVELDAYNANTVEVSTGNGEDYVYAYTVAGSYDNTITIDTGNADDLVDLYCYGTSSQSEDLDVALGRGDDTIDGYAGSCEGTIDGGKGEDSCSGLTVVGGSLDVINCED